MPRAVNVYFKKKLRLEALTIPQREMWALGNAALRTMKERVAKAYGPDDKPAPPLKDSSWIRIKKKKGLKPIRDLHGTGATSTAAIATFRGRTLKRRSKLRNVGHLMDQLRVNKVADNQAIISEPTTDAGRMKARGNREMFGFSPFNRKRIQEAAQIVIGKIKKAIIKTS